MHRTDAEKPPIGLEKVKMHTPITKNMEYFWPLNENKTNLQVLMYDTIKQHASTNGNYTDIVLGSIQDNRMATKVIDKIVRNVPELNSPYEEADISLVLHAAEAAEAGAKRLVVLSADTDILVLMLYYWRELERKGINELWFPWFQAIGRYIPIHKLALKLGADFCKVIPAVHALTGCDYSSKAGTKAAALIANPVVYLKCFGSLIPMYDFKAQVQNAESYLCQVFKKQTAITDINKLRSWLYHHT